MKHEEKSDKTRTARRRSEEAAPCQYHPSSVTPRYNFRGGNCCVRRMFVEIQQRTLALETLSNAKEREPGSPDSKNGQQEIDGLN
jgi:hypothetical protein